MYRTPVYLWTHTNQLLKHNIRGDKERTG